MSPLLFAWGQGFASHLHASGARR